MSYGAITREWCALRPHGGFDLLMVDPPWSFEHRSEKGATEKSAQGQYQCTSLEWIMGLPFDALASANSICWLWATNPMLPQAIETLKAWGFDYKTAGHWSKKTAHGKQAFWTGYILRCAGEPFLIGTRGRPKTSRSVRSVIEAKVREHSRKPDEAFAEAERLMPGAKRIEIFSRQARPGWAVWGNEVDKFTTESEAPNVAACIPPAPDHAGRCAAPRGERMDGARLHRGGGAGRQNDHQPAGGDRRGR